MQTPDATPVHPRGHEGWHSGTPHLTNEAQWQHNPKIHTVRTFLDVVNSRSSWLSLEARSLLRHSDAPQGPAHCNNSEAIGLFGQRSFEDDCEAVTRSLQKVRLVLFGIISVVTAVMRAAWKFSCCACHVKSELAVAKTPKAMRASQIVPNHQHRSKFAQAARNRSAQITTSQVQECFRRHVGKA